MSDTAKDQAIAQAQSVAAMVAALNVDYDRLEELREELEYVKDEQGEEQGQMTLAKWIETLDIENSPFKDAIEELIQLMAEAGECKDADEARERITEDALSVEVREDWKRPGESATPSEFKILLCTGGPAVQIRGELDDNMQPSRAWIEYQDWGTPWTQLYNEIEQSTLLEYCQQFYFGE